MYFGEPVGRVKIQETNKNIPRYYTLYRPINYLFLAICGKTINFTEDLQSLTRFCLHRSADDVCLWSCPAKKFRNGLFLAADEVFKDVRAHCYCAFFRACHAHVMHRRSRRQTNMATSQCLILARAKESLVASWDSCRPRFSRKCHAMTWQCE